MSIAYKKLEEVCEILDSRRVPITAKDRKAGVYPYYGANGLQDYVAEYIFDDELVLLAEDGGNFGSKDRPIAYRVSGKCWVNNHAHVLKAKPIVNVDYLCYALMYYDTEGLVNGATRQKLTQAAMRQMVIPYRDKTEQEQIVDEISQVVRLIDKRKEELLLLDQLVKSRFVELFGDTPDKDKKMMVDICKIITDGTHQPPKFAATGIPFLFVSNIVTNEISYDAEKFISEETYAELIKRTPIAIGDILLSTVGSYGHPAVVKSNKPFCFQRHIAYLKPNADMVNSEYLHGAILSADVQRQIDARVKGIAQKTLNLSEIRKLRLPVPSMEQQKQFAAFVEQTDKSKYYSSMSYRSCQHAASNFRQEWMICQTSNS
ncbi:MAG: restriction endonuclease subunit S [Clostridia bacterium]|nr:restriction endonuclease subunit S [Clostridia bacterium]